MLYYLHHNGGEDGIFIYNTLEEGIDFSQNTPRSLEFFADKDSLQNRVEELGGVFTEPQ